MNYLSERQPNILARYKAGMSLRRISEIYGGSQQDIAEIVAFMQQAETMSPAKKITTPAAGKAACERSLVLVGSQEDREADQPRGRGRIPKLSKDQKAMVLELIKNGQSVKSVAMELNVHISSVHRWIKASVRNTCNR